MNRMTTWSHKLTQAIPAHIGTIYMMSTLYHGGLKNSATDYVPTRIIGKIKKTTKANRNRIAFAQNRTPDNYK